VNENPAASPEGAVPLPSCVLAQPAVPSKTNTIGRPGAGFLQRPRRRRHPPPKFASLNSTLQSCAGTRPTRDDQRHAGQIDRDGWNSARSSRCSSTSTRAAAQACVLAHRVCRLSVMKIWQDSAPGVFFCFPFLSSGFIKGSGGRACGPIPSPHATTTTAHAATGCALVSIGVLCGQTFSHSFQLSPTTAQLVWPRPICLRYCCRISPGPGQVDKHVKRALSSQRVSSCLGNVARSGGSAEACGVVSFDSLLHPTQPSVPMR
jgi:hypothetical protein